MTEAEITKNIRRRVAEHKSKALNLSHTVRPFLIGNSWKVSITDHKPELKRRFH